MMPLLSDLLPAAGFALVFPAIFTGGVLVRRHFPDRPELSRKFVHIGGGLAALFFPFLFRSTSTVLLLALVFAGFILFTKRKGVLASVHGVGRHSLGAVYFPVAIFLLFLLGRDQPVFYVISILVLTVSDSLAALVGTSYGAITYEVEEGRKSLEGSLVFFFITFLCTHLPLLLGTGMDRLQSVLIALVIALLVTGFEAISLAGSDNIFVPVGTFLILEKMAPYPLSATMEQTGILFLIIVATLLLTLLQKVFKPSGLVGMILLNYAAWSLCDFSWLLPLLLAQAMLSLLVFVFRHQVPGDITNYQVRVLFYSALVPVGLIFAANVKGEYRHLYLPYVAAVVCQMALIFAYFLSVATGDERYRCLVRQKPALRALVSVGVATLVIAVPSLGLYPVGALPLTVGQVVLGTLTAFCLFHVSTAHLTDDNRGWLLRQRLRMAASGLTAAVVYLAALV